MKIGLLAMMDSRHAALIPPPSRAAAVAGASSAPSAAQGAGGHDFGRLNPAAISLTHPLGAACFKRRVIPDTAAVAAGFMVLFELRMTTARSTSSLMMAITSREHSALMCVMTKVRITSVLPRLPHSMTAAGLAGVRLHHHRNLLAAARYKDVGVSFLHPGCPRKTGTTSGMTRATCGGARAKVAQAPLQTQQSKTATNTKVKAKVAVTAKAKAVVQARAHSNSPPQAPLQAQVAARLIGAAAATLGLTDACGAHSVSPPPGPCQHQATHLRQQCQPRPCGQRVLL